MSEEECTRHPGLVAEYEVAMHYLNGGMRQAIKAEQLLGPLCSECRMELLRWACTRGQ